MAEKRATVVIERDRIRVVDKTTGHVHDMGKAMPTAALTEERVRLLKTNLERGGTRVDVKEMER